MKKYNAFEDDDYNPLKDVLKNLSKPKTYDIELPSPSSKLLKDDYDPLKDALNTVPKPKTLDIGLPNLSSKLFKEDKNPLEEVYSTMFKHEKSKVEIPDFSYKHEEIKIPDISYKSQELEVPKPIEKRPSLEEENWMLHVKVENKILLGVNGVTPHNFKFEKKQHDLKNEIYGKDDSFVGNNLDDAFGPSSLGHTSLDRMLDEGREIMAARWDDAMELGKKA